MHSFTLRPARPWRQRHLSHDSRHCRLGSLWKARACAALPRRGTCSRGLRFRDSRGHKAGSRCCAGPDHDVRRPVRLPHHRARPRHYCGGAIFGNGLGLPGTCPGGAVAMVATEADWAACLVLIGLVGRACGCSGATERTTTHQHPILIPPNTRATAPCHVDRCNADFPWASVLFGTGPGFRCSPATHGTSTSNRRPSTGTERLERQVAELVAEKPSERAVRSSSGASAVAFTVVEPDLSYRGLTFGELRHDLDGAPAVLTPEMDVAAFMGKPAWSHSGSTDRARLGPAQRRVQPLGDAAGRREHCPDPGKIAELGPGPGVGLQEAPRRFVGARMWGIDPSPEMLAQSRRRNLVRGQGRAAGAGARRRRRAGRDSAPRCRQYSASHVLYFWHQPADELLAIHRCLRPGGAARARLPATPEHAAGGS